MKRLAPLGTALAAAVVALTAAAAGAPAAHADSVTASTAPPLRYVSYNLCGNECPKDFPGTDDNQRRIDSVAAQASATTWNADEIFLQEVCRPQYDAILGKLAPLGFNGLYTATLTGRADVCGGADYGVAVLVRGSISDSVPLDLTVGGETEPIKAACVRAYVQSRANWACSVHLFWNGPSLGQQEAVKLAAQAKTWEDAGTPVVLAGDFNAGPRTATTSQFYDGASHDGGVGTFTEADQSDADHYDTSVCAAGAAACRSGAPTFGTKKIDYVFLSSASFRGAKEDVLADDSTVSDHDMVRGAASWADCGPAGGDAVFRRDATGALYRYAGRSGGSLAGACKVGYGWNGMRMVARQGQDLLAVDTAGALWRYPAAAADGSYSGSTRIAEGTGWGAVDTLLSPGDFNGDGKADLIGRDTSGVLWLYPGDGSGGFGARTQIGTGWQSYDQLLSPGDFTGDGKPDLIGRDASGALWLYAGNGAGSYSPRTQIGTGWQTYTALAAPGDLNGDGRADLVGRDASGGLWFYAGDGAGYYGPRTQVGYSYPDGELLF
jgi:endonuclease/exonuclease/phosphatase family metal-dependent hydrolase